MNTKSVIEAILSGVSGIHIQGQDFVRIDDEIEIIATQLNFAVKEWNMGYGWVDSKTKRALKPDSKVSLYEDLKSIADGDPSRKIYVIKNAYSALNNDLRSVVRLQQEMLRIKRYFSGKAVILLVAKENIIFSEIADLLVTVSCPPLSSEQAEQIFNTLLNKKSIKISTEVKTHLVSIFSGMERDLIFRIVKMLENKHGRFFPEEAVNDALREKKRAFVQSGLLELVDSPVNIDKIGGLERLKGWLRNKKRIVEDLSGAQRLGISPPKGILLAGLPGCGKSMSAKAAASLFNVPLFRLDIGSLMGKFVGQSEENIRGALGLAEKASPCVLWIDELEKAFAGIHGSGGSTEITTRLFGYFLTWMQEKPGVVFVVATANDITTIPPELLRSGRFDEIFYIDLPSKHERKQIFEVKIKSLSSPTDYIDFGKLADKSNNFSGADIESVINNTLEDLFRNKESVLTQDMLEKHIDLFSPIGDALEEKLSSYRELFKKYNLKAASLTEEDIKNVNSKSNSPDSSERENAATNEFISSSNLLKLIRDNCSAVRLAALKNPQCPIEGLKYITDRYKPFDFNKPGGSWTEYEIRKKEFELALQHPNMNGELIIELYTKKVINAQSLVQLAHKLSPEEQKKIFDTKKIQLSRSIPSATVQKILCHSGDIVNCNDILIEIDNEDGNTQQIKASVNGFVVRLRIKVGDVINGGKDLAEVLVPKNIKEA